MSLALTNTIKIKTFLNHAHYQILTLTSCYPVLLIVLLCWPGNMNFLQLLISIYIRPNLPFLAWPFPLVLKAHSSHDTEEEEMKKKTIVPSYQ